MIYKDLIFNIEKAQCQKAYDWAIDHIKNKHNGKHPYSGAIGGSFGWKIIPTGLGEIVIYFCICGEETNVTDFESW